MPKKSPEEIAAGFNTLRVEQRQIGSKIYELESDLSEHKIVIEALKGTDQDRKCYRMIGGVLVERTVKEVLPDLTVNAEQMNNLLTTLTTKLTDKGKEILEYRDKHPNSFVSGGHPEKIVEEEEPIEGSNESSTAADKS